MRFFLFTALLTNSFISESVLAKPTDSPSGINQITWTGFDQKTMTLKVVSASPTGFILNLPPALPSTGAGDLMVYTDAVQVAAKYIPKTLPFNTGHWFVQRRIMAGSFGKDGQTTELAATNLSINSSGMAVSPAPGFPFPLPIAGKMTYLEYRLGHLVSVLDKGKKDKNGFPVFKQVAQYLDATVSVPVIVDLCQVSTNPVTYRPLPCEFEPVNLKIYGKNGAVLATVLPTTTTPLKIPNDQAIKVLGPNYYYKAEWTVRRIHPPSYPPQTGYLVTFGITTTDSGKEADSNGKPLAQQPLTGPVNTVYTIPLEIRRGDSSMHLLLLENDVTRQKFNPEQRAIRRAETYIQLNWP